MGGIANCCCVECIEPPEIEIDGLTSSSAWVLDNAIDCCWKQTFTYDGWPISNVKYTSGIISEIAIEFIGRRTIVATVGTVDGSDCIDQAEIDVAYVERWSIYEDAYRKYAYIRPGVNEVTVTATLVEIIELGVPVEYWVFEILEQFTATYGLDRKFRSYNDEIRDTIECGYWANGSTNINDNVYAARPTSSWVEQSPIAAGATDSSRVSFKIKLSDLEALPPGDWDERTVSSEDPDTEANPCIPGEQDPFSLSYSIDSAPDCSAIEVIAMDCGEGIDTTGNVLFSYQDNQSNIPGRPQSFGPLFLNHVRLSTGCCIDTTSVCDYDSGTGLWDWSTRGDVITSNCTSTNNPADLIVHVDYTVRVRL